jgi:DNA-directed RNA polymerase subunit M/transcription elongation factor TFIIS
MQSDGPKKGSIEDGDSINSLKRYKRRPVLCPSCNKMIYVRRDPHRGESVCEECGYVYSTAQPVHNGTEIHYTPEKYQGPPKEIKIDEDEYQFVSDSEKYRRIWRLQYLYEKKTKGGTEYRHESLYQNYVDVVGTQYNMNNREKSYVLDVLEFLRNKGGLQRLARRMSWEAILLALCVYSMRQTQRDFNVENCELCKDTNLGIREYTRVIENLVTIQGEYYHFYRESPGG